LGKNWQKGLGKGIGKLVIGKNNPVFGMDGFA